MWQRGDHVQASTALEGILAPGKRALVWGEPFTSGNGMHNIHQNQGDPAGSQWWNENGIWQDGGTLAEQPNGSWIAFINKFTTQSAAGAGRFTSIGDEMRYYLTELDVDALFTDNPDRFPR